MSRIVITGAGGFLGRHLCAQLATTHEVVAADLPGTAALPGVAWRTVEGTDGLARLVRAEAPDVVIHAAFVNRPPAGQSLHTYLGRMLAVNLPLFEAMAEGEGALLLVSSSAVYGAGSGRALIDETCPVQPISPYGVAKSVQETMARFYATQGLRLSIARLFNLCGPGQKRGMLLPDWVGQAQAVVRGESPRLSVRHRQSSRDFVDVRDAARALSAMAEALDPDTVYNIASGQSVSLMAISEALEKLSPVPLNIVETDPAPASSDALRQCGSFEKIKARYGWMPTVSWQRSLRDLWDAFDG